MSEVQRPTSTSSTDADGAAPRDSGHPSNEIEPVSGVVHEGESLGDATGITERVKTVLIGKPRDLADRSLAQHVSLVAFLAWVGLGADGLSSSCYGPAEAFGHLEGHTYLAVVLAAMTMLTVLIISACYSHIVEEFPAGGGGYVVATKLLGRKLGVVSGSALLVDYVLTVTTSIAAAGDALFGLLGPQWAPWKLTVEVALIVLLVVLNLRGVKESVLILMPIFLLFLLTHALLIAGGVLGHLPEVGRVAGDFTKGLSQDVANPSLGFLGVVLLVIHAYSLGAGTYTGIEAVSNSMPVMREPRVATAKKTMLYMALSLAITAGGLMLAYLLYNVTHDATGAKTMNQLLTETFLGQLGLGGSWLGWGFVFVTILSEGLLLVVAAQAGFIDGPRVLANMAQDSWAPHWFANLSERLTTHNGIIVMGAAALAALVYTGGQVSALLVMYSINVFVTFSLSMVAMCRHWWRLRGQNPLWRRRLALFATGAVLCVTILTITVIEKFSQGGWLTIAVTSSCVGLCIVTNRYYRSVSTKLTKLDETLGKLEIDEAPTLAPLDPGEPTAAVLVGNYSGLGVHTILNVIRFAPGYYKNMVFLSAGVLDSGNFKGADAVGALREHSEKNLEQYVELARRLRMPAKAYLSVGTDVVDELEELCRQIAKDFPRVTFFAGQLVFRKDAWYQRLMHNQTAFSLQRRLQWTGLPMVILPTRVR